MTADRRAHVQAIVVMVVATLCYCLYEYVTPFRSPAWERALLGTGVPLRYHSLLRNHTWDGVLFYVLIPLLTIVALRQNPLRWGLGLGDWRWTIGLTVVAGAGAAVMLAIATRLPVLQRYYAELGPQGALWPWVGLFAIDMLAWEFLFRAFMLFGLEPALGELAIYVQMIPFAIAHIGKPQVETLSSIAGGIVVGYVVRRCRSFWPAFVLHLAVGYVMYTL
ncbi:MAG: CPBP family intramembrane metalloprotease [Anaerolineae bacterium]|nr:CPBP family intramembrane metalloprotease [Anaerolineae bacterium]